MYYSIYINTIITSILCEIYRMIEQAIFEMWYQLLIIKLLCNWFVQIFLITAKKIHETGTETRKISKIFAQTSLFAWQDHIVACNLVNFSTDMLTDKQTLWKLTYHVICTRNRFVQPPTAIFIKNKMNNLHVQMYQSYLLLAFVMIQFRYINMSAMKICLQRVILTIKKHLNFQVSKHALIRCLKLQQNCADQWYLYQPSDYQFVRLK